MRISRDPCRRSSSCSSSPSASPGSPPSQSTPGANACPGPFASCQCNPSLATSACQSGGVPWSRSLNSSATPLSRNAVLEASSNPSCQLLTPNKTTESDVSASPHVDPLLECNGPYVHRNARLDAVSAERLCAWQQLG
eukprot:1997556-Rhodomonas_salina.2